MTNMPEEQLPSIVQQRIDELPESVQQAIADAEVEKKLRALSAKYKLHLDQWVLLEDEIMMTLLDLQEAEDMTRNIAKKVGVERELAQQIVNDIAIQVFQPIHKQLRGELDRDALARGTVDVGQSPAGTTQPEKEGPSDNSAYIPGQNSLERRDVQDDPYRESIE